MKVEQIYTGCLAEAAYYIASGNEAVIIDPLRETQPYLKLAEKEGTTIKYIFLTHFHADFVSGQLDLAKATGATIVFGPNAEADYEFHQAKDGEIFKIGDVELIALHTPGHTMESTTYLLKDENGNEHSVYSGDTLFIGDVGRPDLAVKQGKLTEKDLAKHLFHSLRNKIMTLPDHVIVYPGHGAGSACGKNLSSETFDTLGNQKKLNYALREDMTEEEFIEEVLTGLKPPPGYFPLNVGMNKKQNDSIDEILERGTRPLSPSELQMLVEEGALLLDVRTQFDFVVSHIPGSIFIGLNGNFAPWVGAMITNVEQPIVLVVPEGKEEEAVTRLSRIGFDKSLGFLKGGIEAWIAEGREVDSIEKVSPTEFETLMNNGKLDVLDVRKESEYFSERLMEAENIPLDDINSKMQEIDPKKKYYIHCQGGYRSIIFGSILKARGFHNFVDVGKGFNGIKKETKLKLTDYACPTTMP